MDKIQIHTEFITLGQFLKLSGVINNGGEAKLFLDSTVVLVSGSPENRRGRKLRPGDVVRINKNEYLIVSEDGNC